MLPALHIHLLGDFRLVYGDEPVTSVGTARLQALLAFLVLHRETPQPRQRLAFLFWPDSTEAQARNNLRQILHQLRQQLPDADGEHALPPINGSMYKTEILYANESRWREPAIKASGSSAQ